MAREDFPVVESIKTDDHWAACGGHSETYLPKTVSVRTLVNDDTVSRPRPSPLWDHPTSLGPNYTKERHNPRVKSADPWYTKKCNDGKTYPGWYMKREVDDLDGYPSSIKFPSWQYRLANKIADVRVNLSSDIAEIKSTASMVADLAIGIRRTILELARPKIRKIRRRRKATARANARVISDIVRNVGGGYLVVNFGYAPTIGQVCAVIDKTRAITKVPRLRRVTLHASRNGTFDDTLTSADGRTYTFKGEYDVNVRPVAYVEYILDDAENGLTAGNILSAGWELVTFSFVIDWIIPIGSWLSSLTAVPSDRVNIRALTLGYQTHFKGKTTYTGNQADWVSDGDGGSIEQIARGRSVLGPEALWFPPLPDFNEKMGVRRALNAIALLAVLGGKEASTRLRY
jgi:hypothetical protein